MFVPPAERCICWLTRDFGCVYVPNLLTPSEILRAAAHRASSALDWRWRVSAVATGGRGCGGASDGTGGGQGPGT